jgi:MYXO-CTERM domain-containing protein
VTADVTDPDGTIIRVELHIDGELVGSRFEEPWAIDAPDDLALGPHDVEVIAFDDTNAEGTSTVSVMVVEDDGGGGGRRSRGCSTGGAPTSGFAAGLLLFALALKRRRG